MQGRPKEILDNLTTEVSNANANTLIAAGTIAIGTIATLANIFVGDRLEAATFFALTLAGAYQAGELNPQRMQERRRQAGALFAGKPTSTTAPVTTATAAVTQEQTAETSPPRLTRTRGHS